MHIEKKTLKNIFKGVITCIVLYWILNETERVRAAWSVIKGVFSPFVLGASLAFVLNVPMRAIERGFRWIKKPSLRRFVSVVLTSLALLLVLTLVFLLLIPQMIDTIQSLIPKISAFIHKGGAAVKGFLDQNPQVMEWLAKNTDFESLDWSSLTQKIATWLGNGMSRVWGGAVSAVGNITGALVELVIAVVFTFYCLFSKETLARQGRKLAYAFLPERFADNTIRICRLTNATFSNFLSGQCIEVCILGCMFAISMAIFKMPYIPLVSVLVAVTAFIPVVGAWAGCALGAFFILVNDPLQAVWFVIMFVVLQQIENNLIYPRVVGTSIGLPGMWVLVAVAIGGEFMGVAGMFLMIPFSAVLYTLLRERTHKRLEKSAVDPGKLEAQPPELRSKTKGKTEENKTPKNDEPENTEEKK